MAAGLSLGRGEHTTPVVSFFVLLLLQLMCLGVHAQLSANFYASSCPNLQTIVRSGMRQAVNADSRLPASLLRLFFHDCFVNGCDASLLLVDTATFTGEQNAGPNRNSIRGMGVIDTIKASVEAACNATRMGLSQRDLVALSGAHTVGFVRAGAGLSPLDVQTPSRFDNAYYQNLVAGRGVLGSDRVLFSNTSAVATNSIVQSYVRDSSVFFNDFVAAMVRMGNISPLTGTRGEIRRVCSRVN